MDQFQRVRSGHHHRPAVRAHHRKPALSRQSDSRAQPGQIPFAPRNPPQSRAGSARARRVRQCAGADRHHADPGGHRIARGQDAVPHHHQPRRAAARGQALRQAAAGERRRCHRRLLQSALRLVQPAGAADAVDVRERRGDRRRCRRSRCQRRSRGVDRLARSRRRPGHGDDRPARPLAHPARQARQPRAVARHRARGADRHADARSRRAGCRQQQRPAISYAERRRADPAGQRRARAGLSPTRAARRFRSHRHARNSRADLAAGFGHRHLAGSRSTRGPALATCRRRSTMPRSPAVW